MSDDLRYLIADAWDGWLRPVLIIIAVAVLAATYVLDWLAEPAYARLLSASVAAVAGLGPAVLGALLARRRLASVAALVLGLVWAAAYVWPTWQMVDGDEPAATRALDRGDDLRLDSAPDGGVTLLVAAGTLLDDGGGANNVSYRLKITDDAGHDEHVEGELSRHTTPGRRGNLPDPGAKRTVVHAANLHSLPWPAGTPLRVHVTTLTPAKAGKLTVSVLPWTVPWLWLVLAAAIALVVAIVVDGRFVPSAERSFLPHAGGVALAFVLLVHDGLSPLAPVKPLFGSVLIAFIVGALVGAGLSALGRRLLGRRVEG